MLNLDIDIQKLIDGLAGGDDIDVFAGRPDLRKRYDRYMRFRTELKDLISSSAKDGMQPVEIILGLAGLSALTSYATAHGNRAKARDTFGEMFDEEMTLVDETTRGRPVLAEAMQLMERASSAATPELRTMLEAQARAAIDRAKAAP